MVMENLVVIKYLSCNRLCGLSFQVQVSGRGVPLNPIAVAFPGAGGVAGKLLPSLLCSLGCCPVSGTWRIRPIPTVPL